MADLTGKVELTYRERPAHEHADGLLILHHGRGGDCLDLQELGDILDRTRRLHVVTPEGPLKLPGVRGHHWFATDLAGQPEHETFESTYELLGRLHEHLWEATGIPPERTVIGGFSTGGVMAYALGLGADRPRPAGIIAFSAAIPTVEGWEPDLESRHGMPVFIVHGRGDKVLSINLAHCARTELEEAGLDVTYVENAAGHQIDQRSLGPAIGWLAGTV
ncbi:MAG TPA: phospholipase [Solirubrobacteraceae bacterium]|nr:phospholipase [Solirubrobacteraceae bacterium]